MEFEGETVDYCDFGRRESVQLLHSLNFFEGDEIAVLELVALVFVDSNHDVVFVALCGSYDECFGLFSISVVNLEFLTIIDERVSAGSKVLRKNEAFRVSMTIFVKGGNLINVG